MTEKKSKKLPYQLNSKRRKLSNKPVTRILIGLNLLFFIAEVVGGGSENLDTLYTLGALVPEAVWQGQFWRLITANFLHYGWLHLLFNMLGLYIIGNLVESISGRFHYLLIYFTSGIGAMFAFTYGAIKTNNLDYILVGSSAAIMGLVGNMTAIFLREWWREKSQITTKRLLLILSIVIIQFSSDYLIPQVSASSHLFGFVIGFILGSLLLK